MFSRIVPSCANSTHCQLGSSSWQSTSSLLWGVRFPLIPSKVRVRWCLYRTSMKNRVTGTGHCLCSDLKPTQVLNVPVRPQACLDLGSSMSIFCRVLVLTRIVWQQSVIVWGLSQPHLIGFSLCKHFIPTLGIVFTTSILHAHSLFRGSLQPHVWIAQQSSNSLGCV